MIHPETTMATYSNFRRQNVAKVNNRGYGRNEASMGDPCPVQQVASPPQWPGTQSDTSELDRALCRDAEKCFSNYKMLLNTQRVMGQLQRNGFVLSVGAQDTSERLSKTREKNQFGGNGMHKDGSMQLECRRKEGKCTGNLMRMSSRVVPS
ncbi:hypothetical protein Tco_0777085 [Tanacetum coccineum]